MEKQELYTKIIKICIGAIFAIFFVVLLSQYISIAQLKAKQANLNNEYATQSQKYSDLTNEYNDISNNYDDYATDYARDNYDYVADGEILINK